MSILTYLSIRIDPTCTTTRHTATRETLRCKLSVTNLGQRGDQIRPAVSNPRAAAMENSISEMKPLALLRYQYELSLNNGAAVIITHTPWWTPRVLLLASRQESSPSRPGRPAGRRDHVRPATGVP